MADVVLIHPLFATPLEEGGEAYAPVPLGIAYLGACLEQEGFSVRAIDMDVEGVTYDDVEAIVKEESPGLVGISVTSFTLGPAYILTHEINEKIGTPVVVGGPHITDQPDIAERMGAAFGLIGESERSFPMLCSHIINNSGSLESIPGLVVDGEVVRPPEPIKDINSLPMPAIHLFKLKRYKYWSMLASRGCPFKCIFCTLSHHNIRYRSPEKVVDEMEKYVKMGGARIEFADDVFTMNRKRTLEICRLITERGLDVRWSAVTRADLVDYELLKEMRDSGCYYMSFGVESGVERIRKIVGKEVSDRQLIDAYGWCNRLGLKTRAYAMFGHPTETFRDMQKTIDFVKRLKPTHAMFVMTTLVPRTELTETSLKDGRIDGRVWDRVMLGLATFPKYLPEGVSEHDLEEITKEAFRQFYMRIGYVLRTFLKMRSFEDLGIAVRVLVLYMRFWGEVLGGRE